MHYRRRELIQFIRRTRSKTSQSGQFIRKTKAKTVQATKHRQPHDPRNKHTPRLRSCRSDIPCTLTSHSAAWFGRLVALPTQEDRLQTTNIGPNTRGRRPGAQEPPRRLLVPPPPVPKRLHTGGPYGPRRRTGQSQIRGHHLRPAVRIRRGPSSPATQLPPPSTTATTTPLLAERAPRQLPEPCIGCRPAQALSGPTRE